jgi:hypothetical protein
MPVGVEAPTVGVLILRRRLKEDCFQKAAINRGQRRMRRSGSSAMIRGKTPVG